MVDRPLLAFGFANAAILGWLAAAAAPILIHLWMKRVHRETPWAAVRFLQAAIKRNARRLRLQEWILLAVRTAIILCVVFAASKPLLDSLGGMVGAGTRVHRVLVIDASLSMRLQTEDGTLLDGAKRLARELVDRAGAADQFSLCVMAGPKPTAPVASPTVDRATIRRAIDLVEPTDQTTDLPATLAMLDRLLAAAEKTGAERREVLFFTDLARAAWAPLAGDGQPEAMAGLAKLTDRGDVAIIDVGLDAPLNATATALRVTSGAATTRAPVRLVGEVRQFGGADGSAEVELLVDGLAVASRQVALSGGAPAAVEFEHRFTKPGWSRVELRLPSDRLAGDQLRADNLCRLAVNVQPRIEVLCVEGGPDACRYLADAINPTGDRQAPLVARVISDAQLAAASLDGVAAVVLSNVSDLTAREAARLVDFARGGGGVLVFLGERCRPDRYNAVLGGGPAALGRLGLVRKVIDSPPLGPLLPVEVGPPESIETFGLDPLGYEHPIVAPFRGRERAGLLTTPVERRFRLRPLAERRASVVLATSDGAPLVVAAPVGAGRVVVVGTAGSLASIDPATGRPWTAMPAWPSFVPIVRETLRWVTGAAAGELPPVVDEAIAGRALRGGGVRVLRPDGTSESAAEGDNGAWRYNRTDQAGYYVATAPDSAEELGVQAVNVEPAESDPTRLASADLPAEIAVRRVAIQSSNPADDLPQPVGLHRGLLLLAAALAAVETWLAYWFGRGAA
ncbi:MAG: BatA domain-containing protein [Planctomycetota bacterium]